MAVSVAGVMATPGLFGAYIGSVVLIDNTSQYSYGVGGEFRAVGDSGLDSVVDWNAYSTMTKGVTTAADLSSWGGGSIKVGEQYFQTFCIDIRRSSPRAIPMG